MGQTKTIAIKDLVDTVDISNRYEVEPDTVRKWIRRHSDFPQPEGEWAIGKLYDWRAIRAWVRHNRPDLRVVTHRS